MKIYTLKQTIEQAQKTADSNKENQVIYTTIEQGHEIYQYTKEKGFNGRIVRVVQYTGNNIDQDILQDSGNEQPELAIANTGKTKRSTSGKTKRDMVEPVGLLLPEHEPTELGELSSELQDGSKDSE